MHKRNYSRNHTEGLSSHYPLRLRIAFLLEGPNLNDTKFVEAPGKFKLLNMCTPKTADLFSSLDLSIFNIQLWKLLLCETSCLLLLTSLPCKYLFILKGNGLSCLLSCCKVCLPTQHVLLWLWGGA